MLKLRWGILGTGNIAGQFVQGLRGSARSEVAAVASRRPESANGFVRKHQLPTAACGDYESLLKNQNVDAIYISLPNSMHHEWTIKSLRAGKHILCEKPFAVNADQTQEMFDESRRAGRVLVEAFMYRSHPQTKAVMDAIQSGAIGTVRLIRSSFCYRTTKIDGNIRFDRALAGGALMDVGCYCLNFSRLFAGAEPTSILANAQFHPSGIDEITSGALKFPNGISASFTCGMAVQADNTASICGSEGFIEIPVPWKPPASGSHFVIARGTPPRMDGPVKVSGNTRQTIEVPPTGELYALEADDFAATVLDGAAPAVNEADTLGNMRVLDEIRRQIGLNSQ